MPGEIPDQYLDMVMTCPFPEGQAEGAKPLREVLASDIGPKIMPHIIENIQNAEELAASGIDPERATVIAFGGALVRDEEGAIVREPEPDEAEAIGRSQPELQGAEKK